MILLLLVFLLLVRQIRLLLLVWLIKLGRHEHMWRWLAIDHWRVKRKLLMRVRRSRKKKRRLVHIKSVQGKKKTNTKIVSFKDNAMQKH